MCLYAKKGSLKTAEEDIRVYKVVRTVEGRPGKWSPLYFKGEYDMDKVLDAGGWDDDKTPYIMHPGETTLCVGKGFFHSTVSDNKRWGLLVNRPMSVVRKATIPAGSKYYKDDDGNYASDKIIVHSNWF